jgi:hypothetical protein
MIAGQVRYDAPTADNASGDAAPLKGNNVGAIYTQEIGGVANGLTLANAISAATNNSTNVKASAGQVYFVKVCNINAAVRWLKLYNKASAPTCGTDTPVMRILAPVNSCTVQPIPVGATFGTGIGYCIVTGATDADNTATAANEQTVEILYK